MSINNNEISKDMKTAYHEAGHAVMYYHYGEEFKVVTINAGGYITRKPKHNYEEVRDNPKKKKDLLDQEVIGYLAGIISENILCKKPVSQITMGVTSTKDYGFLITQVANFFDKSKNDIDERIEALTLPCLDLVNENWFLIKTLADALMIKRRISYDEAMSIIDSTTFETQS